MYVENLDNSEPSLDANDTNVGIPGLYIGPVNKVVEEANLFYLTMFAIIYLVASLAMGGATNAGRILDVLFVVSVIIAIIYAYVKYPVSLKGEWTSNIFKPFVEIAKNKYNNLTLWQSALLFLLVAYVFVYIIGIPMGDGKPITISIFENLTWVFIASQLIYLMMKYWFSVDLFELLQPTDGDNDKKDDEAKVEEKKVDRNEVFNIADNKYTYKEAAAVCSAFDARLASYSEVEDAYKAGGEWCNYGWSADQMIYYPTQMQTWTDLQKNPATKHSCGRPGVNGGFMANPHLKFGVNCYGKRPAKKDSDIQSGVLSVPKLPEDIALEKQVQEWQANKDKMLRIHSFNRTGWAQQT